MPQDDEPFRYTKTVIPAVDQTSRAIGAAVVLVVGFAVLALLVSPWFWIGSALFLGGSVAVAIVRHSARR